LSVKALAEGAALLSRNKMERLLRSNPMQDVLASRFNAVIPSIEFNTPIKTIDYASSKIKLLGEKIRTDGGTENISMEVDKVIVTVPVSILKTSGINFIPALPASKTISISHLGMDACIRMVLDFKQNFWGERSGFLYGGDESPEYFNIGVARSQFNKTLGITIGGPQAEKISALGVEDAIQAILKELDMVFAGKASFNIRKDDAGKIASEYFDWSKLPFIKGGTSYVKPEGKISDRTELAKPVNEVLFFAGEATDDKGESGTINGALLSGKRVAQEVVDAILNA
jgi:monoamine oxidase